MKRDMDLIRDVLLAIEKDEEPRGWISPELRQRSPQEISYHVMLLNQAGLVDALDTSTVGEDGFEWVAQGLTWRGHEYLDTIRDPEVWQKTKEGERKIGGFSFEIIFDPARWLIKKKVKDYTEIEIDL